MAARHGHSLSIERRQVGHRAPKAAGHNRRNDSCRTTSGYGEAGRKPACEICPTQHGERIPAKEAGCNESDDKYAVADGNAPPLNGRDPISSADKYKVFWVW